MQSPALESSLLRLIQYVIQQRKSDSFGIPASEKPNLNCPSGSPCVCRGGLRCDYLCATLLSLRAVMAAQYWLAIRHTQQRRNTHWDSQCLPLLMGNLGRSGVML